MRGFIEKLAEKSKKEGEYRFYDGCSIESISCYWYIFRHTNDDIELQFIYLNTKNEYQKQVRLKIYPDEYDLLKDVLRVKEQELRLATIDFLNNL